MSVESSDLPNQTLQYKKQQLTENLGGYVVGGTTEGRRQMLVINTLLTHPKICNSHVTLRVQQHIVQLQIPGGNIVVNPTRCLNAKRDP